MHSFTDAAGRQWAVTIDAPAIRRVRELLDIHLEKEARDGRLMHRLADLKTLVDVLYVVCHEQAIQRSMTDEEFGRAMVGSPAAFILARDSLSAELAIAFPAPAIAIALTKTQEAIRQAVNTPWK